MMINEQKLDAMLLELGHDDYIAGNRHLRRAVIEYRPGMRLTKELYPRLAKVEGVTPGGVERSLRHAMDKAWARGSYDAQRRYFGWAVSAATGRPQAGEYIARLARLCQEEIEL